MKISDLTGHLESVAPLNYQEDYDNAGLLTGDAGWECTGVLCSLDVTEEVINEAISRKLNLIVVHHPIIFRGLKRLTGENYVQRAVIAAVKNNIAIYAIHTNLDNIINGVNGGIANKLELINQKIIVPSKGVLKKLFTFVPLAHLDKVRDAIFMAGGGDIGNYSDCSFSVEGIGSFKGKDGTSPYVGEVGKRHYEKEVKLEVIFPEYKQKIIIEALLLAHPYEEVAYDVVELVNVHKGIGSGLWGELKEPMSCFDFLALLKEKFHLKVIRHSDIGEKPIRKVGICGGAGTFLISSALALGLDAFVTADIKYHEFFEADSKLVLCDIGHFESERFTIDLLLEVLQKKFHTFAVLKSEINTNPVCYYF